MLREILVQPLWLQLWIAWLIVVNTACLGFLARREARWVLAAWLANGLLMSTLHALNGYNRLLGLSHVVCWTPFLVYLWRHGRSSLGEGLYPRWLRILFTTNLASLVIDYIDVARYLLGDRG